MDELTSRQPDGPDPSLLPDREDRDRIVTDLGTSLLVEAGAGSGKTHALVERMIALVRDGGAEVESIAAVTFTRKAASELRERFQTYLEDALAEAEPGEERDRLDRALRAADRAFVGTIHSFCARLLRERPLEAGLDPGFKETLEAEEERLSRRFWALYLERVAASEDSALADLDRVGLRPALLEGLYRILQANPDVDFLPERAPPPDPAEVAAVRDAVERLLDRAQALIPDPCPHEKGPDRVQKRLKRALFHRRVQGWGDERDFLDALIPLVGKKYDCTYVRWSDDGSATDQVKALEAACRDLFAEGGPAARLVRAWWAHRYPVALEFARGAAEAYRRHRHVAGWLNFNDLLLLTAELLRESPRARRDLGRRYRHLLIDEFQDTDPIQAEVAFLLASDPEQGDRWLDVEPRPGQLFVVGDPKQSIYRFRRADMSVYDAVRRRFAAFGDVLTLTANFRSCGAVGDLVNDVFRGEDRFPGEPTVHQARFAPLLPQPPEEPRVREGVFHYRIDPKARYKDDIALDDAERLATWIAARVRGPDADRAPGDFLVITRDRSRLEHYVRALEARGLPVQVSGARVTAEEELEELRVLLRALTDPGDPVATVAALSGIFFGLDAELLLRHREEGGRFDLRTPTLPDRPGQPDVVAALTRLRGWWLMGRSRPSDLVVEEIVETAGLVPWAAAGELGQLRAGALLYGLEAVRAACLDGDASLVGALDAIDAVLESPEAEASLEPGRADAVTLLNLHKAKGLEAPVVVLAAPFEPYDPGPDMHVRREEGGANVGWLRVEERVGRGTRPVAQPLDWPEKAEEERRHDDAERLRLQYVAATRARDELVVARSPARDQASPWAVLHPWLDAHAAELDLPALPPPERPRLEASGDAVRRRVDDVEAARDARGEKGYDFTTVTLRAKRAAAPEEGTAEPPRPPAEAAQHPGEPTPEPGPSDDGQPQMELFAGVSRSGADLSADRGVPTEEDLAGEGPTTEDAPAGEGAAAEEQPAGMGAGMGEEGPAGQDGPRGAGHEDAVDDRSVRRPGLHRGADWGSAVHATLQAAARGVRGDVLRSVARAHLLEYERPVGEDGEPRELSRLLETVDSVRRSDVWRRAEAARRLLAEVPFTRPIDGAEPPTWLDGQVDLAFREDDGWVLVDWKTDLDPDRREAAYRRQLVAYGEAWEAVTGERVKERLILYTRVQRVVAV